MRKTITRFCLLSLLFIISLNHSLFAQQPSDLLISEYVEGSSNNKAIELYNGTGAPINLATGNYVIVMYFNGSTTAGTTIPLTGTIAPNGIFVLAQASATFASAAFVNQTNSGSWYNGDDAVLLRKGGASGAIVDAIGQLGVDPGAEWGTGVTSTADNTLRRKASDCTGDENSSDAFDPAIKFDGFVQDDFSGLGVHTSSCVATGPSISVLPPSLNFSTTPGTPSVQQTYTVQGNSLTSDITVTVPALSNFGISLVSGGPYTSTVTVSAAAANAAPVTVYVIFSPAASGTQSGNITHTSDAATANLPVQGTTTSGGITPVYAMQGIGLSSPIEGTVVTTEGLVTADFQGPNQLNGFFIQDTTGDGNTSTSDGIFVFNTTFAVAVGDYVRITGEIDEFNNLTELKNLTSVTLLSAGHTLMAPVQVSLPVNALSDLEQFEGMLVTFPQTLTATETFTLGRFGEVALSANGRLFNPTNFVDPNDNTASGHNSTGNSNVAAVTAQQSLNDRSRILLDDGSNVQNPPVVPYLNPADTTLRIGTTINNLTGVLHYDFGVYRLNPTVAPAFNYAPRPAVPSVGAANLKIASFNVLNYFNGNGTGGGFPTSRGANTLTEFNRQRTKIIAAISQLNADVIGLMEIENDGNSGTSAIADLVNGLNAVAGAGTYQFVADPSGAANGTSGTDEIKVGMIYKPAVVSPVGVSKADINPVHNRPPLAQTFSLLGNGEKFTVIVNHFKSKSCTGASGLNVDQLDGQACFNQSRKLQADALVSFINSIQSATGDSDVVCVGDFNAYEQEDPIDILTISALTYLLPGTHSYVFEGQSGSLDYGFITPGLASKVTGADRWHINADEPIVKDYNQEFNPTYVFTTDAFRSSDHDPVLVGLNLQPAAHKPVVTITSPANGASFPVGTTVTMNVTATDPDGTITRVEFYANGAKLGEDTTAPYQISGSAEAGTYALTAKAFDNSGDSTVSDTVTVTLTNCTGAGTISVEGFTNINGSRIVDLASNIRYPNNPDVVAQLNNFEYGPDVDNNYGARTRGYICAPQTGFYKFYIASDDQSELWLSTDDNPANIRRIAYVESRVNFRSWFSSPTQTSVSIRLVKGIRYYIETLHKEGTGSDHLSVGWRLPNGVFQGPIPGSNLSPWITAPAAIITSFGQTMRMATREVTGQVKELTVNVLPNPSPSSFTLVIRSNSEQSLTVTLTDVLGRVVERKAGVAANGSIRVGDKLHAGVYFVEVMQGQQKKLLKLIRK
jgi:uncharacterized protein